jgi:arginine N-succinyltransferase
MMLIRPITVDDFEALQLLAQSAGVGFTSLPPEEEVLHRRIERAVKSFARESERAVSDYLFVLETAPGMIGGCSGVAGAVGLETPWYHYRKGLSVRHSKRLQTVSQMKLLFLSNDLTGSSELCTLLLSPMNRKAGVGAFLSKHRFLFIADHPELFGHQFIAEMRGCIDENGSPPFWEHVGKHFFKTDFRVVDRFASSGDKTYIAEMMLTYPIYLDMLPISVQSVVSQVQPDTLPAVHLLESEGFKKSDYIDIFDAGPVMLADVQHIRAIRDSKLFLLEALGEQKADSKARHASCKWMVSNRKLVDYRVILVSREPINDTFYLTEGEREYLGLALGAVVRAVKLYV